MATEQKRISYLEFYSGVGGWTMALEEAAHSNNNLLSRIALMRVAALDHSDLCHRVLDHNFPKPTTTTSSRRKGANKRARRPTTTKAVAIEKKLTKEFLESHYAAQIWAMSPPCQPHTRQHSKQSEDLKDPRSQSFLHLCQMLRDMQEDCLPVVIFMENVVGFEMSSSCRIWREALSLRRYRVGHFHLTPTQVGIPNDRPRYFCVAVLERFLLRTAENDVDDLLSFVQHENLSSSSELPTIHTSIPALGVVSQDAVDITSIPPILDFLDDDLLVDSDNSNREKRLQLQIPDKILKSDTAWCFDIVTPQDRRTACFTSSYGKFVRGTGSVLYEIASLSKEQMGRFELIPPEKRQFDNSWADGLDLEQNLRYFSGTEVARLMGFPVASSVSGNANGSSGTQVRPFSFPLDCTLKQQWKLLGNSLNVRVASRIAILGLRLVDWSKVKP